MKRGLVYFDAPRTGSMSLVKFYAAAVLVAAPSVAQPLFSDATAGQQFLQKNCGTCHTGKNSSGFDITKLAPPASFRELPEAWTKAALRVHNGEMPPGHALPLDQREGFAAWVQGNLRAAACAEGTVPGPAP